MRAPPDERWPPAVPPAGPADTENFATTIHAIRTRQRPARQSFDKRCLRRMAEAVLLDGAAPIRLRVAALRLRHALALPRARIEPAEAEVIVEGFEARRAEVRAAWSLYR